MEEKSSHPSFERLKFCNFKLNTLLNITQAINQNLPTNGLLHFYENLLHHELNIGKVIIFGFNQKWDIILKSGVEKKEYENIDVEKDLLPQKEINITLAIGNPVLRAFDFIIPVFHNNRALAYVLIGDFEEEGEGISPTIKHLHFIQTLTNVIIVAIENKRLIEENMQQERLKKELEMASKMQEMLVPSTDSFTENKYIQLETFYLPHYEVGGDYYDFDYLSEDEMFFCIADVSGKGMSAALLMSNFQASLRALITSNLNLTDLVKILNQRVIKSANGEKFITFFIAKYNFKTQALNYVNAGHNPPILYDRNLETIKYLTEGCTGMGMIDEIPSVVEGNIFLPNRSKLFCYTDGIAEIEIDGDPDAGLKTATMFIASQDSIELTFENIKKSLNVNKNNTKIFDDITLLGLEILHSDCV